MRVKKTATHNPYFLSIVTALNLSLQYSIWGKSALLLTLLHLKLVCYKPVSNDILSVLQDSWWSRVVVWDTTILILSAIYIPGKHFGLVSCISSAWDQLWHRLKLVHGEGRTGGGGDERGREKCRVLVCRSSQWTPELSSAGDLLEQ